MDARGPGAAPSAQTKAPRNLPPDRLSEPRPFKKEERLHHAADPYHHLFSSELWSPEQR